ncbi:MAG: homoserine dehydrogenase, partial [Alphaproteobacteria bacterium]|nr:homoserine dehydrogenase [Alphaproteobacteria bacterium]
AGKGKNNPLNRHAIPAELAAEAAQKNMNPRVLSEFVDGTKTMVEMTALANATGLIPDTPGMHGRAIGLEDLHRVYIPREHGGILQRRGVVEYSVGRGVPPGVFAVAHIDSPRLCARMGYLALGDGPFYTFYRPYHLTSLEVPLSCARAVLYGVTDMQPRPIPVAEATAKAKQDLAAGKILDGIGETCYYGWILARDESNAARAVPLGLLDGAKVLRPVPQDKLLTYADVRPNAHDPIVALRAEQDTLTI